MHLGNFAWRDFPAQEEGERLAKQFICGPAKELRAGIIDARDPAIHVSRVDDVGGVLNNVSIAPLNAMTLREARYLDQQFFVTKWNFEIVVGAGAESFQHRRVVFAHRAHQ